MLKRISRRFMSFLMILVMIMPFLPDLGLRVQAADVTGLNVSGLSASYSNGTWTGSGTTLSGSVTGSTTSGCAGDTHSAITSTLTLTNVSGTDAVLEFDISGSIGSGNQASILIDGQSRTSGSYSKALQSGGSIDVVVNSGEGKTSTSSLSLSNIYLNPIHNITITFKTASHGTYSVNGADITTETTMTNLSSTEYALKATPESGYKFLAWYNERTNRYLSNSDEAKLLFSSDQTIEPIFVSIMTPVFETGNVLFTDLNEALSYAQSNNQSLVVLVSNGTLQAGNYTIPSGKTLLIPFDDVHTCYTSIPSVIYGSHTNPTAYRTLTLSSGANITIAAGGAISLSGKLSASGQMGGWNGTPTGPDGRIKMEAGSSITVKNGANLYCWGYVYGSGSVVAESGSTVYEAFQIKDWRGGTATSNVYEYAFIFNQYYVQNIEVPLTMHAGATEKLYSSANASSSAYPMGATFIGNDGMFNISSGYIIKDYSESSDRLIIDFYGNASILPMTISGLPLIGSMSTSRYVMPITSNITISLHGNNTTTISQDISLLPSTQIIVDSGATLNIASGKKVYVYDNDQWGNYTGSARLYVIGYSVANGTVAKRNSSSLVDSTIDVNGIISINGDFYSSTSGAQIISSEGTGQVKLHKSATSSDVILYEMKDNSEKTAVSFTAAQLCNGDGTYISTTGSDAGTTYFYCRTHDKWESGDSFTVSFDANGGEGTMSDQVFCPSGGNLNENTFSREDHVFTGWNSKADGSGTDYEDCQKVILTSDITLYAQWTENHDHIWGEPDYSWAMDNSTVTASRICIKDSTHVETETVNTVVTDTTPATCTI